MVSRTLKIAGAVAALSIGGATLVALYQADQRLPPQDIGPVCCAFPDDPRPPQPGPGQPQQPSYGPPPQPGADAMAFVPWADPNEQAFSTQVPRGWQAKGGLVRPGGFQAEGFMRLSAPDGRSVIFTGDPSIPTFAFPNQTMMSLGYREGQPVTQGGGRQTIMMRFQDPALMAAQWVQRNLGQAQVTGQRPRPDLAGRLQQMMPVMQGSRAAIAAADVDFTLADGRVGTITLMLAGQETPGLSGLWKVDTLYGFAAPRAQAGQTARALGVLLGSFRTNPIWFAREAKINAQDAQMMIQSRQEIASIQQRALDERWASQDRQARQVRDVLGGTARFRDPNTGEIIEAQDTSNYQYRDPYAQRPTLYGTDVDSNPDPTGNLRRMDRVGTDVPDE